ncbi:MAG: hypothetical protein MUE32_07850 [Bacteroidales bacterium]|jgi:hypothetical protein|nr:hypothetical protein [Bacteroidales bacterium]
MMKIYAAIYLFAISTLGSPGQNLVGYNSLEIRKFMKENHSGMIYNSVVNSKFSYLKYTDGDETLTTLFFLNENSVCNSIRMICDYSLKAEMMKEINAKYKKSGDNTWIDTRDGNSFIIRLKEEKWACTITIEPETKE